MARAIDANVAMKKIREYMEDFPNATTRLAACRAILSVLGDENQIPTLTPLNEWVNRMRELEELYIKFREVTGFTAEQLLKMFSAGYTLEKPDYSKSFEEMASLAETTPPNEPLFIEQLREMDGKPVYIVFLPDIDGEKLQFWALVAVDAYGDVNLTNNLGGLSPYEEVIANIEAIYRRPPEGEEDKYEID